MPCDTLSAELKKKTTKPKRPSIKTLFGKNHLTAFLTLYLRVSSPFFGESVDNVLEI